MTRSQAVRQAMDKYVDIWGIDWVKEGAKHIGSESCNRPDGLYEFRLVNWTEPYVRDRICRIDTAPAGVLPVRGTENLDGRRFKFKAEPQNGLSV